MRPRIRLFGFVLFLAGLTMWGGRACSEPGRPEVAATPPQVVASRPAR